MGSEIFSETKRFAKSRTVLLLASVALAVFLLALAVGERPASAAFPGENGKIAFVSTRDGNEEIYVMNADGTNETRLTTDPETEPGRDIHPMFSPDGKRLTFTRRPFIGGIAEETIHVMDPIDENPADGSGDNLVKLTPASPPNFMSAFSPDGSQMVFQRQEPPGSDNEIWVMDADGTNPVQLTDNTAFEGRPVFSPDGTKIAYARREPGNPDTSRRQNDVYVMNADGTGEPTRLTTDPANDSNPSYSPDGKKIAFDSNRLVDSSTPRNADIYVMKPDGTDQTRLISDQSDEVFPAFSPDGKQLAFSSNRDGNVEIYVTNASGTADPVRLTETDFPAENTRLDWGPDTTKPEIVLTMPTQGATYTLNQSVMADYECADEGGSGLASCVGDVADGAYIDTATVGSKTFTVTATDNGGNTSSVTHTYSVNYDFQGFLSPVDNLPTINVVKAGRAIPVKFSLGGDQGLGIFAEDNPKTQQIDCDSATPVDVLEETSTAGGSGLSYDAATGEYTYVWKTSKAWADSCRQLVLKLDDGTVHQASFTFK